MHLQQEDSLGNVHYMQIGIVAGGLGTCRDSYLPAVYVRLEDEYVLGFITAAIAGILTEKR